MEQEGLHDEELVEDEGHDFVEECEEELHGVCEVEEELDREHLSFDVLHLEGGVQEEEVLLEEEHEGSWS